MNLYEFRVEDKDGLWGSIRLESPSESEARESVMVTLANEVNDGDTDLDLSTVTLTRIN